MQFKRCQIPTSDFHPGLQRNPFKTNNSKISNDPAAVFSPLLTARCRKRPSSNFLLKLLLSHTGKLLAEVGTDPQLRVLSQISPPCDITKGRDPEQWHALSEKKSEQRKRRMDFCDFHGVRRQARTQINNRKSLLSRMLHDERPLTQTQSSHLFRFPRYYFQ